MRQSIKRVAIRYSAGTVVVVASLVYMASCQSGVGLQPANHVRADSASTLPHTMDDEIKPPKQPGGPGCCQ